jgi:hypothetical protein
VTDVTPKHKRNDPILETYPGRTGIVRKIELKEQKQVVSVQFGQGGLGPTHQMPALALELCDSARVGCRLPPGYHPPTTHPTTQPTRPHPTPTQLVFWRSGLSQRLTIHSGVPPGVGPGSLHPVAPPGVPLEAPPGSLMLGGGRLAEAAVSYVGGNYYWGFPGARGAIGGSIADVPGVFPVCSWGVPGVFQGCSEGVPGVSWLCSGCVLGVFWGGLLAIC